MVTLLMMKMVLTQKQIVVKEISIQMIVNVKKKVKLDLQISNIVMIVKGYTNMMTTHYSQGHQ